MNYNVYLKKSSPGNEVIHSLECTQDKCLRGPDYSDTFQSFKNNYNYKFQLGDSIIKKMNRERNRLFFSVHEKGDEMMKNLDGISENSSFKIIIDGQDMEQHMRLRSILHNELYVERLPIETLIHRSINKQYSTYKSIIRVYSGCYLEIRDVDSMILELNIQHNNKEYEDKEIYLSVWIVEDDGDLYE